MNRIQILSLALAIVSLWGVGMTWRNYNSRSRGIRSAASGASISVEKLRKAGLSEQEAQAVEPIIAALPTSETVMLRWGELLIISEPVGITVERLTTNERIQIQSMNAAEARAALEEIRNVPALGERKGPPPPQLT